MLGGQFKKIFSNSVCWDKEDIDVTDYKKLELKIQSLNPKPNVVINCVAFNDVDGAEEKREIAFELNSKVPGELAKICKELSIPLMHFSSNYVFDGQKGQYQETDVPNPLSVYGLSKAEGEQAIVKNTAQYYIIRTAVLFGPKGESELSKKSFIDIMLELSQKADIIKAVADEINSVTYIVDLANQVKKILSNKIPYGIYHVTNVGGVSWYNFAREIFSILGKQITIIPVASTEFLRKAIRPKKSILFNTKLPPIRPWQEALKEYLLSSGMHL